MSSDLQDVVGVSFVSFEGCSRGEVAGPEAMRMVSVGEEVVRLRCPCSIGFVQSIEIAGRRRIEDIHITTIDLLNDEYEVSADR